MSRDTAPPGPLRTEGEGCKKKTKTHKAKGPARVSGGDCGLTADKTSNGKRKGRPSSAMCSGLYSEGQSAANMECEVN